MADGLVIKHPTTGAVIFNAATITGHSRAAFNTSGSAGSLSVAAMLRGSPFIIQVLPSDATPNYNVPDFQISGSTISWNAAARNMRVLAGSRAVGGPGASANFDGFMVRRPEGALQVSTADQAIQLASFGSLTLQDDGATHPQPMVSGSITVSGVNPVLAFRGQTGADINVQRIVSSGGNWTFHFRCQSSAAVGLIYWIFDATGQALMLSTNVGLILKDSTGVKTFDSRAWALNIVDHVVVAGTQTQSRSASGRTYAAIQSTPGYVLSQQDRGGYSSATNPPSNAQIGEVQNPRPGGTQWAYMRAQAWHSTARATSGGGLLVGSTEFENYSDWFPNSVLPSTDTLGTTRHCIVDVTGLPSATMPTPGSVSVSVSSSLREVTVSASSPASTISPIVTASASGGTAPYDYDWYRREGGGGVGAYGPTDQTSFRTQTANQPPGSTYEETWGCRVTDAVGVVGYSPDVVFRHIVTVPAPDPNLDPIDWGNIFFDVTSNSYFTTNTYRTMAGINQNISLSVVVSDFYVTGGAIQNSQWAMQSATRGDLILSNLGNVTLSATVQPNEQIRFGINVATTGGRREFGMNMNIYNATTGAFIDHFSMSGYVGS